MKRFAKYLLSAVIIGMTAATSLLSADDHTATSQTRGSGIEWMTNYEDALNKSQASSKPVVLFFTGTGWCGWCTKLEQEVFNTQDFSAAAKDKFIFVKLDFPRNRNAQDAKLQEQNQRLQTKFGIKGFPTVVVIDSHQKQIGTIGYEQGGGKKYADHLLKMSR